MELFVSGFLLSLSLCLDLGVVNVAIVRTGLQRGTWPAFWLGFGSSVGDMVYATVSLVALSYVLQYAAVRWMLWLGGTLVLLILAYRMVRESISKTPPRIDPGPDGVSQSGAPARSAYVRDFLRGLLLALSSPSAILWFATVGGSVIASSAAGPGALAPFFVGFFASGVTYGAVVAIVTGRSRRLMGPSLLKGLSIASAALFLFFAVKVFVAGPG